MWFSEALLEITRLVQAKLPVPAAMKQLVAWCAKAHPHPDWSRFDKIGIEDELPRLDRWLRDVLTKYPPATNITAFWFGLFNPTGRFGRVRSEMYVAGSNRYTGAAGDMDWQYQPAYWPESRYAGSRVLEKLYRAAYRGGNDLNNDAEYPLALGYAAFAVAHLCKTLPPSLLLSGAPERAAVVGFDSGDYLTVGTVRPQGFTASA